MRPLSYELVRAGCVHWIDPRFNLLWDFYKATCFPFLFGYPEHPDARHCVRIALAESYFLHFAGKSAEMRLADAALPLPAVRRSWLRPQRPLVEIEVPVCRTAVALILYNRADKVAQALAAIRAARPRHLYLIADGPRDGVDGDAERCAEARAAAEAVDWDCEVHRDYAAANLGIKARVDSGLDRLFDEVEEAIILEDDCIAHPTFFRFCEELLARNRHEPRVMSVCGTDFCFGLGEFESSYAFSRYPLIWGWATWRRAWRLYDPKMSAWPAAREGDWLASLLGGDSYAVDYWSMQLEENFTTLENWDMAWLFSSWQRGGLSIHPRANLVTNVGFGAQGTHTLDERDVLANLPAEEMAFPLLHPPAIERNAAADDRIEANAFGGVLRRLWAKLRQSRQAQRAAAPR